MFRDVLNRKEAFGDNDSFNNNNNNNTTTTTNNNNNNNNNNNMWSSYQILSKGVSLA